MEHKFITRLAIVLFIAAAGVLTLLFTRFSSAQKLPDDLYNQFGCGRKSLDIRPTDIYCEDYRLYKLDRAAGKIQ